MYLLVGIWMGVGIVIGFTQLFPLPLETKIDKRLDPQAIRGILEKRWKNVSGKIPGFHQK
jgi:hypothetical protein